MRIFFISFSIIFLAHLFHTAALAQKRYALLIGNQNYSAEVGPLKNPVKDIRLIARALQHIGFQKENIKLITNADRITLLNEVDEYSERLGQAGSGAIGFFYYSGHGAARDGQRNYLLPIGVAKLDKRLWRKSVVLDEITLGLRKQAPEAVHFVVFDACRNILNLPIKGTKGFKAVPETHGMVIAFSSAPGHTASDLGENSGPYAKILAKELRRQGVHHLDLFQNIKEGVFKLTGNQIPWERNGLLKRIYLAGKGKVVISNENEQVEIEAMRKRLAALEAQIKQQSKARKKDGTEVAIGIFPKKPPKKETRFIHGHKFDDCNGADWCPKMIVIRGGTFTMGPLTDDRLSEDQGPPPIRIDVSINKFAVGRFEITFAEWNACVSDGGCNGYSPSDEGWGRNNHPVINVSWNDAQAYVKWLSRKTGKTYRLLTEAEWEYAATANRTTTFSSGNSISSSQANFNSEWNPYGPKAPARKKTVPVDSFNANPFGLYNVHGNVQEWVEDCWHDSYRGTPRDGSAWLNTSGGNCNNRILRGGHWHEGAWWSRPRYRAANNRNDRRNINGFRVARTLD